jgi:methylmalonyl-CoA mutase cobalamin-binding subunit
LLRACRAREQITYRLLVAVGTLCCSQHGAPFVRQLAADLGVDAAVATLAQAGGARVRACAGEVGAALSQR